MRAVCWNGRHDVRVERVPDPEILNPRDAIVRVTSTAICGSDLHLYGGLVPGMMPGDILGHEFMGEVVDVGSEVQYLRPGDRVVVPCAIACGNCDPCSRELWSLCDNSNPNARELETMYGYAGGGLFGYSHLYGGYAGGQAEFVRVPFADVGPLKITSDLPDEQVLFLSDIFPTGFMAAENCEITPGDVVAVWGCGPVGQFAIRSALLLGAEQVIAIDRVPTRLQMAADAGAVETIDFEAEDVHDRLRDITVGRGPDACIDAVGFEAHGAGPIGQALREAINACGKGGTVSVVGVYAGKLDKLPMGAAFAKGLTMRMSQVHVHRYMPKLLEMIENDLIAPGFVVSHRLPLERAPEAYDLFLHKDGCTKVVLTP